MFCKCGFAKVVKSVSDCTIEETYALVVKTKDEMVKMTSADAKKKVMESVSDNVNVRVNAVRKTRSGGLTIETVTESDWNMLRECKKFGEVRLRVEPRKEIGHKVVIYDMPNEMSGNVL